MPDSPLTSSSSLPVDAVRSIARLARLTITPQQADEYGSRLGAVLGYVDRLRALDLSDVEPMHHPGDLCNTLRDDESGSTLSNDVIMRLSPSSIPPFIRVPKVIGGESGA
jgi:aspartyl-tRNA(Asn)/glutamyl-tRNA(Gln) amidotransferase subunit C